jgi:hypothetical protein
MRAALVRVAAPFIAAIAVMGACSHDFDQYGFGSTDSGAGNSGGGSNAGAGGAVSSGGASAGAGGAVCAAGTLECGGTCVASDSDRHCGSCSNNCRTANWSCVRGDCGCTGSGQCGTRGFCEPNLGSCRCLSGRCQLGESCQNDACSCNGDVACNTGELCCPDTGCVDPNTDAQNCGGCGRACPSGQSCTDGSCG